VKLCLSNEVPLLVEYALGGGVNSYLRFYLAPKVSFCGAEWSKGVVHG